MDRIIREITDKLAALLPEDKQYYSLMELRHVGFPNFIIQRIQVELEKNLAESMRLPRTEWANMDSERVKGVWQQFIAAIRAEARLPASYAHAIIETAVADVLEMLIQPRKNIPEVVFGTEKELDREQVRRRTDAIAVYRHFASLLTRYMEKKELKTLTKERCKKIIASADEKITSRYSPLNWAQLLEPLFSLLDEKIDTNLMRLFFEDKKMPRIARQFDLMDTEINRAKLIEILSSPDSLNFEGYQKDQPELFEQSEGDSTEDKTSPGESAEIKIAREKNESSKYEQPSRDRSKNVAEEDKYADKGSDGDESDSPGSNSESKKESSLPPEDTVETETGKRESENETNEDGEEPSALNNLFQVEGEEEQEQEQEQDEKKDHSSDLNRMFAEPESEVEEKRENIDPPEKKVDESKDIDSNIDDKKDGEAERKEKGNGIEKEKVKETEKEKKAISASGEETTPEEQKAKNKQNITESDKEEIPMWQRYLSPEDREAMLEDREEEQPEDEFIEEPIIDLTANDAADAEEVERLLQFLESDRSFFTEHIFRDSDRAYEEAVEEIASKEDWRSATEYIDKEVFKRNMVDMYSEAAVDFTDRLHSYFVKRSKSKS